MFEIGPETYYPDTPGIKRDEPGGYSAEEFDIFFPGNAQSDGCKYHSACLPVERAAWCGKI